MIVLRVSIQLHSLLHTLHIEDFHDAWSLSKIFQEKEPCHFSKLFGVATRNRGEGTFDNFHDEWALVFGFKGVLESAQLVEDAAERPNVAFVIIWLLLTQLRAKIIRRPNDRMCHILRLIQQLGYSQITDLYFVILAQEHIYRFYISM